MALRRLNLQHAICPTLYVSPSCLESRGRAGSVFRRLTSYAPVISAEKAYHEQLSVAEITNSVSPSCFERLFDGIGLPKQKTRVDGILRVDMRRLDGALRLVSRLTANRTSKRTDQDDKGHAVS